MITLYGFGPALDLPDPSPFVTKAEMLLKLAGLAYELNTKGFRDAPKGKLPYIRDEDALIADSTLIRWHIESKYRIDFDGHLSAADRAVAWAVEKMLEDHLYWAVVDARWCDDRNFNAGPSKFFHAIPWPMRGIVQAIVRRKVAANLKAHGLGRHSPHDLTALATKDIESLAAILGDKPYLMGDRPCGVDATAFAFTAGLLCPHFEMPLRTVAEQQPNLVAYARRMKHEFYPALVQPKVKQAA